MARNAEELLKRFHLRFLETGGADVILPLGYPIRASDQIEIKGDEVWATRKEQEISPGVVIPRSRALVSPYFTDTVSLKNGQGLTIKPVFTADEWLACQRLPHYLQPPPGMYICGKIEEEVVGVLILSRLAYHMRPSWRREFEKTRGYLEALWIRRISVSEDYQGAGVGGALARAAVSIGSKYWLPKPRIVELIATGSKHGFLTRNGYTREDEGRRGYLKYALPDGSTELRLEDRYYYWCNIP